MFASPASGRAAKAAGGWLGGSLVQSRIPARDSVHTLAATASFMKMTGADNKGATTQRGWESRGYWTAQVRPGRVGFVSFLCCLFGHVLPATTFAPTPCSPHLPSSGGSRPWVRRSQVCHGCIQAARDQVGRSRVAGCAGGVRLPAAAVRGSESHRCVPSHKRLSGSWRCFVLCPQVCPNFRRVSRKPRTSTASQSCHLGDWFAIRHVPPQDAPYCGISATAQRLAASRRTRHPRLV